MIPIDRGWAWLILLGAFLNQLIILSVGKSLGLVYVSLIDRFGTSASAASVMQALVGGIGLFIGPIVTALSDAFSCRAVVMTGGLLLCLAGLISSMGRSLNRIVYPFGILGGVGVGMVICPAPIIVARYFDKRRALANGLLYSAAGFGSTLGPLIMNFALINYSINGVFMLIAGWALHTLIGGALYRPLTSWKSTNHSSDQMEDKQVKSIIEMDRLNCSEQQDCDYQWKSDHKLLPLPKLPAIEKLCTDSEENLAKTFHQTREKDKDNSEELFETARDEEAYLTARTTTKKRFLPNRAPYLDDKDLWNPYGGNNTNDTAQPDDCYVSSLNLAGIPLQELPPEAEMRVKAEQKWTLARVFHRLCHVRARDGGHFVPLIDVKILAHPAVALHAFGSMFGLTSFFLVTVIPAHSKEMLLTSGQIGGLMTLLGATETLGRLLIAALGDRKCLRTRKPCVASASMAFAAFTTFLVPFTSGFTAQVIYLLTCPVATGAFVAIHVLLLVDLIGTKRLGSAFGLVLSMEGVTACVTPLTIGILRDQTGSYIDSYYFLASCFLVSSVLIGLIPLANRHYPIRTDEL